MLLSTAAIFGVSAVCCVALISNIDGAWNVGIPVIVLANNIHPLFASIFAFIILLGIYTSACPLLWTGFRRIFADGTKKYKITTVIGCVIACSVPYKGLLNVLYGLNGYLGAILIIFMIAKDIRVPASRKK